METIIHNASSRGSADIGWLKSQHTFSFAEYYDPKRMGFGALRVINDDIVAPSMGFGTHPHKNMEIISVPLKGSLKHKDTIGNDFVIQKGEIQAMSAGTGIAHSEFNNSSTEEVNFLQIWVLPKRLNINPGYSQKTFSSSERNNKFQLIVSPDGRKESVQINQDAFFSLINLDANNEVHYEKYNHQNGIYFFVIEGAVKIEANELNKRDGLGLVNIDNVSIKSQNSCEILVMEVPMLK